MRLQPRIAERFGCEATVVDGRIRIDGELPVATNGGLLSYSHAGLAQMLQKPVNATLQLQGKMPEALNLSHAQVALASNGGSGALFNDVMIVGKEPL